MLKLRPLGWLVLLLGLVLALPGATSAGDEPGHGGVEAQARLAASALDALKLRMEARLRAGDVLRQLGRFEEALEAYRGVEALHDGGLDRLDALLARLAPPRPRRRIALRAGPGAAGRALGGGAVAPKDAPFAEGSARAPAGKPVILDAEVAEIEIRVAPVPGGAFQGRAGKRHEGPNWKDRAVGWSQDSQTAVEDALKWLAAHQSPNGGWEAAGFPKWCDGKPAAQGPDGTGKVHHDAGVTGLALCAYLGAGYTNRGRHPFAKTVSKGLRYLKNVQDPEGCFGKRESQHYVYSHAFAALAMVEAYGMTGSPIFKGSAQKALDFVALSRNPYFAWRYGVKPGDNDTSVTAAMAMVLKSAKLINEDAVRRGQPAPLTIDEAAFDGVKAWLEKMTDPDYGRIGYIQRGGSPARPQELIDKFPGDKSEAMTAAGTFCRILIGEDPRKSRIITKSAELMRKLPPTWNPADGSIDMYYWYYGTLASFQVGGRLWRDWNRAIKDAVLKNQRKDTTYCMYKGSWDPIGPWGPDGGRVYATALMAMCMEVYYRYDRVFGKR